MKKVLFKIRDQASEGTVAETGDKLLDEIQGLKATIEKLEAERIAGMDKKEDEHSIPWKSMPQQSSQ